MSLGWSGNDHKSYSNPQTGALKRARNDSGNKVSVVLGAQWGDEGKGKVVDLLATESDIVCRCQVRQQQLKQNFIGNFLYGIYNDY